MVRLFYISDVQPLGERPWRFISIKITGRYCKGFFYHFLLILYQSRIRQGLYKNVVLCCWFCTLAIGVLVFDERIGILEDNPSQEAMDSIKAIQGMFEAWHNLELGIESMFYWKFDTPSLKKMRKCVLFSRSFATKFVEKKMNDLKHDLENPDELLGGTGKAICVVSRTSLWKPAIRLQILYTITFRTSFKSSRIGLSSTFWPFKWALNKDSIGKPLNAPRGVFCFYFDW